MAATAGWRDWLSKSENQRLIAELGVGAMGAMGAKGDRDYQREQNTQQRGDSLLDKQRSSYLGRAGNLNDLTQTQLGDEYRGALSAADITDPYKYKMELQRDVNRSMQLKKAAQMLGMPTSGLFNSMNTDDAILRRNANAVMGSEMNATDINPARSARNVNQLLGMSPLASAAAGQNRQLAQFAAGKNNTYAGQRQGMVDNTNNAYDQYDKSIAAQIAAGGKIDPKTGDPKKTSKWRTILGNVVKYGGGAAAIALTGGAATPLVMAGSSFLGDKIAGKSTKSALLGAGLSAIPGANMGAGGIGGALGSKVGGSIANQTLSKLANAGIQQGFRYAGENIPYVGAGLMAANMTGLPNAIGGGSSAMATALGKGRPLTGSFTPYRPTVTSNVRPTGVFGNVRF